MPSYEDRVLETKRFLIEALRIEDMEPEEIDTNESLFGEGLGLDSIDALTLVVAIDKKYGVKVPDAAISRKYFENVDTLARFLEEATKEDTGDPA